MKAPSISAAGMAKDLAYRYKLEPQRPSMGADLERPLRAVTLLMWEHRIRLAAHTLRSLNEKVRH